MSRLFSVVLSVSAAFLMNGLMSMAQTVHSGTTDKCKRPITLEVLPAGSGSQYRLNGTLFKPYPLTEMAKELNGCEVERTVDVIMDYHVSLADFLGSVPSKLQAASVRYYIRTETSLVEISVVSYDAKVPGGQ